MVRRFPRLVWPDTFWRRFAFAMGLYQPVIFVTSLIVGLVKQLSIPATMLEVWLWAFVIGLVVSIFQAALAKAGASFWRPILLDRHDEPSP